MDPPGRFLSRFAKKTAFGVFEMNEVSIRFTCLQAFPLDLCRVIPHKPRTSANRCETRTDEVKSPRILRPSDLVG